MLKFRTVHIRQNVPIKRYFNIKKADWNKFAEEVNEELRALAVSYDKFVDAIKKTARRCIPRECSTHNIKISSMKTKTHKKNT